VIQLAEYTPEINRFLGHDVPDEQADRVLVYYRTYDNASVETLRMKEKPAEIWIGRHEIPESSAAGEGWEWFPLPKGGILTVRHTSYNQVIILGN
jgi:hypothetical protein